MCGKWRGMLNVVAAKSDWLYREIVLHSINYNLYIFPSFFVILKHLFYLISCFMWMFWCIMFTLLLKCNCNAVMWYCKSKLPKQFYPGLEIVDTLCNLFSYIPFILYNVVYEYDKNNQILYLKRDVASPIICYKIMCHNPHITNLWECCFLRCKC